MRMRVLVGIFSGLFLLASWSLQAVADSSGAGTVATPKVIVRGQYSLKNIKPNYITGVGYYPAQVKAAYGITGNGAGQTIAIVDAYGSPTISQDLTIFCNYFGLPKINLQIVGNNSGGDSGWALETSLDVEWAHAIAPKANIVLVVANSNSFTDLFNAVQTAKSYNPAVISMSWGGDESSDETSYDGYFPTSSAPVCIAASGDSGSGPQYPAASSNVLSVGGTSLYLLSGTATLKFPEVAWEGSGGGPSAYEGIPAYQSSNGLSGSYRLMPDVSFVSDPSTGVIVIMDYSAYLVGGTSLAAPCWAGVVAIADQKRAALNVAPLSLTQIQNLIYSFTSNPASYRKCLYDITAGFNGDYQAGSGYDLITGMGSPKAPGIINALKVAQ